MQIIDLSEEDLVRLVRTSFEEGLLEGVQKGRGFQCVNWQHSHARERLESMLKKTTNQTVTTKEDGQNRSTKKRRFLHSPT